MIGDNDKPIKMIDCNEAERAAEREKPTNKKR